MPAQYVLPVGLHFQEGAPDLAEGYEVHWRDDEEPPHYFFLVQVSTLRLPRLLHDVLDRLPNRCHAVLEVRRSDDEVDEDPEGPTEDRWVSGEVRRGEVRSVLERYEYAISHDGMVGFGAYDPTSSLEVFLDDHKLLNLFAPTVDAFEPVLARHRVPHIKALATAVDVDHEHHSLTSAATRCPTPAARFLRRRRQSLEWYAEAIRTRLGMKLHPATSGPR